MKKRVIYSYISDDERRFIVDYLQKEHGWQPVFFHGNHGMSKWVNENYPDAVLHDSISMRKSRFDYSRLGAPVPIDSEIISALSEYETTYLNWLEDTNGWNFSIWERRRYYHDVLKFWNTVISKLNPDIFIAYTWPHVPSDYPLYLLCKHYYKIPVLFLDPILFLDDDYHTIGCSLENLSAPFIETYTSKEELIISEPVRHYLEKLRSGNPQIPKHVKRYWNTLDNLNSQSKKDYQRIIKLIVTGNAFKEGQTTFKKNRQPWDSNKSKQSFIDYILFRRKLAKKNRKLEKYYNQFVSSPDYKDRFIYFAAPYQPEAISNLCAGTYEDVFLVLDMITEVLPEDWLIYYKEHPNTFKPADKGALERSRYFYDKVASYSKVRIVPFNTNTFTLIDNSQAVCTVGGTVGWEAVVRGKPALVYGSVWYQACKSVFTIRTYKDALEAIKEIKKGFVPDGKDVERYAEAIHKACEKGLIGINDFREKIKKCADPKYEMERIAIAFVQAYEKFYS